MQRIWRDDRREHAIRRADVVRGVEGLIKRGAGENWTRADMDRHFQAKNNPIADN